MARRFLAFLITALFIVGLGNAIAPAQSLTTPLSVQWVFSMGPDPEMISTPVVDGDNVYVSFTGTLYSLDRITGAEQWSHSIENAAVSTSPVLWRDVLIVGATNGLLYGISASDGEILWERICAGAIAPSPTLIDDLVIAGAREMVYAIEPATGDVRWICAIGVPAWYGPIADGDMLYFVGSNGSVQCVDGATGRYRWGVNLPTGPRFFPPVVTQQRVIVASGNQVHGVSRSGSLAWTAQMPASVGGPPLIVDESLYVPCVDGQLYELRARSGAPLRGVSYKVERPLTATPVVEQSLVIMGSSDGLIYALDRERGSIQWIYRCRAPEQLPNEAIQYGIYSPLLVDRGSLYCLTGTGDLYRFTTNAPDAGGPVFGDFQPELGAALPGGRTVQVSCTIVDDGSGIDPRSVRAWINDMQMTVDFDIATGSALFRASGLQDGVHIVRFAASDFRGNKSSTEWSFLTDPSIQPAHTQPTPGMPGIQRTPQMRF